VSIPNKEEIGEGAALIISITIAWFFMRYFNVFNINSGVKNT
jgi:hypothetical protein